MRAPPLPSVGDMHASAYRSPLRLWLNLLSTSAAINNRSGMKVSEFFPWVVGVWAMFSPIAYTRTPKTTTNHYDETPKKKNDTNEWKTASFVKRRPNWHHQLPTKQGKSSLQFEVKVKKFDAKIGKLLNLADPTTMPAPMPLNQGPKPSINGPILSTSCVGPNDASGPTASGLNNNLSNKLKRTIFNPRNITQT